MGFELTYKNKIKKGDFRDVFKITFDEEPSEFTFTETTQCKFKAKHLQVPDAIFEGECDVDWENKSATYYTAVDNNVELGRYTFEFMFHNQETPTVVSPEFHQTFPKEMTFYYDVVENIEVE